MANHDSKSARPLPDIGFTIEEIGTKTLPTGQIVPAFRGKPNDPEAHRRMIEWIERDVGKTS